MTDLDGAVRSAVADSFLAAVEARIVSRLLEAGRVCEISSGRVFIDSVRRQRCGFVVSGLARVYMVRPNGAQLTLRRVHKGGAIGVRALVGGANTLSVEALTDVEFLELDPGVLHREAMKSPELAWSIAREVSKRLEDTETHIAAVSGESVVQRVAMALVDMVGDELPSALSMSQEHLADVVGASREQVGHVVRKLARDGILKLSRRRVVVLDANRLRALFSSASADPSPARFAGAPGT